MICRLLCKYGNLSALYSSVYTEKQNPDYSRLSQRRIPVEDKSLKISRIADHFSFVNFGEICKDCKNNCCRRFYAVLLPEEEELFKEHSDVIQTREGPVRTLGSPNRICPYLSENGLCKIYDKRPMDCRVWPVLMYYDFNTGERVIYLDLDCDAVREGRVPASLVNKIIDTLKKAPISDEWLKRYTLAPWPNNLIEIARIKPQRLDVVSRNDNPER